MTYGARLKYLFLIQFFINYIFLKWKTDLIFFINWVGGGDECECERMTNLQVIRKTYCRVLDQFNKKPWRKAWNWKLIAWKSSTREMLARITEVEQRKGFCTYKLEAYFLSSFQWRYVFRVRFLCWLIFYSPMIWSTNATNERHRNILFVIVFVAWNQNESSVF